MSQLYVLFEHASGYALFRTKEFEEISTFLPQVKNSVKDISKFRSVVHLISFQPFKTGRDALENINSVSEGLLHPMLQLFLETNVPKSKKKKQPVVLGIADPKLGALITETLGINCSHLNPVPEIIRGVRFHFYNLVKGFKDLDAVVKAQLGLGHHYSRAKVKFNVNRVDIMIIQSISLVDQLDKDINTFSMRVREWYSHHFPELIKIVPENAPYVKCVGIIRDRKNMPEDVEEQLENILMDSTKVQNIMSVARSSMGMEISLLDMENITLFAEKINSLVQRRKEMMEYLKKRMHNVAPNLAMLIGDTVGARLISHAGSLTNLAKYPASTVQILGAEKALFRALKTKGNTPKYGLIYHSTFIGRAAKDNKGRISRYLANKCSMASRIDCFSEIPTEVFGQKLRQQVEDRIKFYESGTIPAKNIDVMTEASDEVTEDELKNIFSKYGNVVDVTIPVMENKKKRGFAFVQFEHFHSLITAIKELNYKEIHGRPVAIDYAMGKTQYQEKLPTGITETTDNCEATPEQEIKKSDCDESESEESEIISIKEMSDSEKRVQTFFKEFDSESKVNDSFKQESSSNGSSSEAESDYDDSNVDDDENDDESDQDNKQETHFKLNEKSFNSASNRKQSNDLTEGKTVFIRNVSFVTTEEGLQEAIEEYGDFEYCLLCMDQLTDHPKGTAFVKFKNKEDAEKLIQKATDVAVLQTGLLKQKRKQEKKAKKKKLQEMEAMTESMLNSTQETSYFDTTAENGDANSTADLAEEDQVDESLSAKKKKQKKENDLELSVEEPRIVQKEDASEKPKKKKKEAFNGGKF